MEKTIVQQFLEDTYDMKSFRGMETVSLRPRIECKDGYKISMQASDGHYCSPRKNLKDGMYHKVELGYPNQFDELIDVYAEEKGSIDTVYGYVPIEVVEALIAKHGGLK